MITGLHTSDANTDAGIKLYIRTTLSPYCGKSCDSDFVCVFAAHRTHVRACVRALCVCLATLSDGRRGAMWSVVRLLGANRIKRGRTRHFVRGRQHRVETNDDTHSIKMFTLYTIVEMWGRV